MSTEFLSVPSRREERFFKRAREISLKSDHTKCKIGAVIVLGNYVVSSGVNRMKSHTIQARYDKKMNYYGLFQRLHSEIDALISSSRVDLGDAEIYVYRESSLGQIGNCRPCVSCTQAIRDAGIRHVFYTLPEGFAYEHW